MKKIFLLFFFTSFCFSQSEKFSVSEIDSIAKTSKNKIQSSGIIKKNKKTIGEFNLTEIFFNKKPIYSSYGENTIDKVYKINHFYELYFSNENPILVKISISRINKKTNIEEKFKVELSENNLYSFKEISNPFSLVLRLKINSLLFDIINHKYPN
ncbi:hypothetical protein [Flavobacterium sp. N2270]|uniref:hypothetical protein n=1 Tax=Flavobacterium sp. N2270 TaxID=2986831 RepID=UPI0022241835|nr:hypothetical protein [Flavobacterium sp. N2270]